MLVHEGAPSTDCVAIGDDPARRSGSIVTGVDADVDAIVSGHTHLAYNCSFPVDGSTAGRDRRPVVSAGQYGTNLNQLVFTVDPDTRSATGRSRSISAPTPRHRTGGRRLSGRPAPSRPSSPTPSARPTSSAPCSWAEIAGDRSGGARLGQDVDDTEREPRRRVDARQPGRRGAALGDRARRAGGAQIAFMNPGGLRADMVGTRR